MDTMTDLVWHAILGVPLLIYINRRWRRAINTQFMPTLLAGLTAIMVGMMLAVLTAGVSTFVFVVHQILFLPGIAGIGLIIFAIRAKYVGPYT